jgi:hypothetical protein
MGTTMLFRVLRLNILSMRIALPTCIASTFLGLLLEKGLCPEACFRHPSLNRAAEKKGRRRIACGPWVTLPVHLPVDSIPPHTASGGKEIKTGPEGERGFSGKGLCKGWCQYSHWFSPEKYGPIIENRPDLVKRFFLEAFLHSGGLGRKMP